MKGIHLLRVERPAPDFAPLFEALAAAGLRFGWLDWTAPEPVQADLEQAAACGALRAVAIGEGRSVALKPMRGQPVLQDVLREHFRGCSLVLVSGAVDLPLLAPAPPDWRLEAEGAAKKELTTAQLVARLRSPRPLLPDSEPER